jgi:hypothetical protein
METVLYLGIGTISFATLWTMMHNWIDDTKFPFRQQYAEWCQRWTFAAICFRIAGFWISLGETKLHYDKRRKSNEYKAKKKYAGGKAR